MMICIPQRSGRFSLLPGFSLGEGGQVEGQRLRLQARPRCQDPAAAGIRGPAQGPAGRGAGACRPTSVRCTKPALVWGPQDACPGPRPPGVLAGSRLSPGTMLGMDVRPTADSWSERDAGICALGCRGKPSPGADWPLVPGILKLWVMGICHLRRQ